MSAAHFHLSLLLDSALNFIWMRADDTNIVVEIKDSCKILVFDF